MTNTFNQGQMPENYNQYELMHKVEKNNETKYIEFKERIQQFEEVSNIEDAKSLAKKIIPVANKITKFRVGDAKCTVINSDDIFRISVDRKDEFISYNFEE